MCSNSKCDVSVLAMIFTKADSAQSQTGRSAVASQAQGVNSSMQPMDKRMTQLLGEKGIDLPTLPTSPKSPERDADGICGTKKQRRKNNACAIDELTKSPLRVQPATAPERTHALHRCVVSPLTEI